jgi:arsenical pump membrane protein
VQDTAVAIVFGVSLLALYVRPSFVRDWHVAAAGGLVAVALGPLSLAEAGEHIAGDWNILAFFLGLMLTGAAAEAAGLYGRLAVLIAARRGSAAVIATVIGAGAAVTAVLSNDATPLVLVPAIFLAAARSGMRPAGPAFAATLVADGASALLPFSNPVNLLFYERFDIGFAGYLQEITPAAIAGLAALAAVLVVRGVRTPWPAAAGSPAGPLPPPADTARWFQRLSPAAVGLLAAAYVAAGMAGAPLGIVALGGGTVLCLLATAAGAPVQATRRHVSFGVLIFVAGLLVLVESATTAGTLRPVAEPLRWLSGQPAIVALAGAAIIATVLSNLMNNWPAALLLSAVASTIPGVDPALIAGCLLGCALGANLTVVGSLSTVFWMSLCRSRGLVVSPGQYARAAWLPTMASLVAACLVGAATAR